MTPTSFSHTIHVMNSIFTIGYGNRDWNGFLTALKLRQIAYLIDVRSNPRSAYRPEFSTDQLRKSLKDSGIAYVLMGNTLGGRPSDDSCYRDGHVVYDEVRDRAFFLTGIRRIQTALGKNLRVCLMCSEGRPEECHRSKLIGVSLDRLGIEVVHIGVQGEEILQHDVLAKISPAQSNLFGNGLTSRKAYKVRRSDRTE
jgi:uncharacterized protein (DUF488 family)